MTLNRIDKRNLTFLEERFFDLVQFQHLVHGQLLGMFQLKILSIAVSSKHFKEPSTLCGLSLYTNLLCSTKCKTKPTSTWRHLFRGWMWICYFQPKPRIVSILEVQELLIFLLGAILPLNTVANGSKHQTELWNTMSFIEDATQFSMREKWDFLEILIGGCVHMAGSKPS